MMRPRLLPVLVIAAMAVTISVAVFASPLVALGAAILSVLTIASLADPRVGVLFLAVYFPLEPFLLKFVPEAWFLYARFFPEVLLYLLVAIVVVPKYLSRSRPKSPIDVPFLLFLFTLAASTVINLVEPSIALLGARQILRFMLVFFLALALAPGRSFLRLLTLTLFGVVVFESALGIVQALVGEPLDALLFPNEARFLGEVTLAPNAFRFWDPGSRIFATMGRYDRLGTFLGFFLLLAVGFLYEYRQKRFGRELWVLFGVGLPALLLTYSRSGWFGFVLGFLLIGLVLKKDRRVRMGLAAGALIVAGYLGVTNLTVSRLVDVPEQPLVERFFEAFSFSRWRGEYYGLGRLFWIVNTPIHVIPASPFFGHGPGQFGGGAVAALHNTAVYDELGLPFGVAGTEGYVDNNWLSIWGEVGTLGLLFYLWMFVALSRMAYRLWKRSQDPLVRSIALGFCGIIVAFSINAFLASFLEARTLAYYFWLYAGLLTAASHEQV